MSSEIAIRADNLGKVRRIYQRPEHRLVQMLTLGRVRKFAEFTALRDISFEVRKGETVGLVGRNGCGKSTLLQIICGTLQASSGSVTTNGRIAALLELGAGFNGEFTGRENVYMNGAILGFSREEMDERFARIAEFAAIGDFVERPVKTYSSGMFVRLAFATAISVEPDILVVDEALSVGDEAFQRKCIARIEQLQEGGGTIFFVSHNAPQVVQLCTRAILLDAGEKLIEGSPKIVVAQYQRLLNAAPDKLAAIREDIRGKSGEADAEPEPAADEPSTDVTPLARHRPADGAPRRGPAPPKGSTPRRSERHIGPDESRLDAGLVPQSTVRYEERGARIDDVHMLNAAGERVNVLTPGHRYTYAYDVTFEKDARRFGCGMLLMTANGAVLGGVNTGLGPATVPRSAKAGEVLKVRLSFLCTLNPDTYFLNAGVQDLSGEDVHFMHRITDAMMIRVEAPRDRMPTGYIDFDVEPEIVPREPGVTLDRPA